MKKIVAIMVCFILVLGNAAQAATIELPGLVTFTDRAVETYNEQTGERRIVEEAWAEYTNPSGVANVSMDVEEYCTVSPIHWLDSDYLSYDILSIHSSDENVVIAGASLPTIHPYSENVIIDVYGRQETLGVQLYGVGAGSATVTVVYRTYLTRQGLAYTDHRPSDTRTQKINVTVSAPLDVSLNICSAEYEYVDSIRIYASTQYDELEEALQDPLLMGMSDMVGGMLGSYNYLQSKTSAPSLDSWMRDSVLPAQAAKGFETISGFASEQIRDFGTSVNYGVRTTVVENIYAQTSDDFQRMLVIPEKTMQYNQAAGVIANTSKVASNSFKAIDWFNKLKSWVGALSAPAVEGVRRQATVVPVYAPRNLEVEITLRNNTDHPIEVTTLALSTNEYLSFYNTTGPWKTAYQFDSSIYVRAGSERKIVLPLYARIGFDLNNENAGIQKGGVTYAYDGVVKMRCIYTSADVEQPQDVFVSKTLRAYSSLTAEDTQKINRSFSFNAPYFIRHYGAENIGQLIYIGCPVEVVIQDRSGNELAVIHTGDAELFTAEGITAGANGERKFLHLEKEYTDDYRVLIHALQDGQMDVVAVNPNTAQGLAASVYQQTALAAQAWFEFVPDGNGSGRLYQLDAAGQRSELPATVLLNQDELLYQLDNTDIAEWAKKPVAQAILNGFAGNIVTDSYQAAMHPDEFCNMLVALYEAHFDLSPGISLMNYLALHENAQAVHMTDVAASIGLVDDAFQSGVKTGEINTLTCEEAASMLLRFINNTLLNAEPADTILTYFLARHEYELSSDTNQTAEEDTGAALPQMQTYGILANISDGNDILTYEKGMAAVGECWDYCVRTVRRNDYILFAAEQFRQTLTPLYADFSWLKNKPDSGLLHAFSFYSPAVDPSSMSEAYINSLLKAVNGSVNLASKGTLSKDFTMKKIASATSSRVINPGISILEFAPVYEVGKNGGIKNNVVYLAVGYLSLGYDVDYLRKSGGTARGEYRSEFMLITDQDIVRAYLDLSRFNLENGTATVSKADAQAERALLQRAGFLGGTAEEEPSVPTQFVIITGSSANIREKADVNSGRITTAYKGDTFPLLGEEGNWYQIEVQDQVAYVSKGLSRIK